MWCTLHMDGKRRNVSKLEILLAILNENISEAEAHNIFDSYN